MEDNVALNGYWLAPSPSPRTYFSAMLGEDARARPVMECGSNNQTEQLFPRPQEERFWEESISEKKSNLGRGLGERIAARAGFNAPRLNTQSITTSHLSMDSDAKSPYLTVPPGLSPTTLLDSPVFLSNPLVQQSPTTGKLPFLTNGNIMSSSSMSDGNDRSKDNRFDGINMAMAPTTLPQQNFPGIEVSVESESSLQSNCAEPSKRSTKDHGGFASGDNTTLSPDQRFFDGIDEGKEHCPRLEDRRDEDGEQNFPGIEVSVESESSLQSNCAEPSKRSTKDHGGFASGDNTTLSPDQRFFDGIDEGKEHCPRLEDRRDEDGEQRGSGNCLAPSDDGYNWRKYGQKPVKGSEYPRSYYKCTHPNCQVKKKVERSREGHIAEIIYKGAHNHPKSSSNRRNPQGDVNEQQQSGENDLFLASQQKGSSAGAPDLRHDNLEETSSASVGPEYINQSTSLQLQNGSRTEQGDAVDASSTFSDEEDEEDRGTHGSKSLGYDGEGDESESKRRKIEVFATESSGASRAIREPRVVVQTTSEVDILDDGYRWRKYGQKVVKGNPNPRSYYKCTSAGCTVRKHAERASHDLKSVITTYEGKHNHAVPARRNSSHMNARTYSATAAQATPTVQNQSLRREQSRDHNGMAKFDRPPAVGPPVHWSCHGINHPTLPNLAVPVLGPGQAKIPVLPINPHIMHHRQANEMGFVQPKGELKGEPMSDAVYHRIMSRLPLGPHL